MDFQPSDRELAFVLPVALVSTTSAAGVRNLAPYSNFTPLLRVTDLVLLASWHRRDTLKNIRATREFVVSVPPAEMADKIMPTAMHYPPEVDEFVRAGLEPKPSKMVAPPGVAGCLAWLECGLVKQYVEKSYVLVVGRVLRMEVAEGMVNQRGGLDLERARPLLASLDKQGMRWATAVDLGQGAPYGAMFPSGQDPLPHGGVRKP